METKSLVAAAALILGFWGVLSAWTFTELASMQIPGAPATMPAATELAPEPSYAPDAALSGPLAAAEPARSMDGPAELPQCLAQ